MGIPLKKAGQSARCNCYPLIEPLDVTETSAESAVSPILLADLN